jgi:hypothetical protein
LEEKEAAPVSKGENMAVGMHHADQVAPSIRKFGTSFAYKCSFLLLLFRYQMD